MYMYSLQKECYVCIGMVVAFFSSSYFLIVQVYDARHSHYFI